MQLQTECTNAAMEAECVGISVLMEESFKIPAEMTAHFTVILLLLHFSSKKKNPSTI